MTPLATVLTVVVAVGAGAVGGVFFAYSTFTMSALARLAPADGAAAMQSINREAPRAPLMGLMFGTAAAGVALAVTAALNLEDAASAFQLIAVAIYLLGVIVVTGAYHVPRNNRLRDVDTASPEGIRYWSTYLREWVRMNHIRTLAPLATAALLAIALQIG
ncbi:MAG: DUF1772 domain-containing protein [Miltoncostaeaceae bacterium]